MELVKKKMFQKGIRKRRLIKTWKKKLKND